MIVGLRHLSCGSAHARAGALPRFVACQSLYNHTLARSSVRAKAETKTSQTAGSEPSATEGAASKTVGSTTDGEWIPVMRPEDLPKGVRKEVNVNGINILFFWYRNQIFAISGRSPAEGAYSEGFIKAKFTQDYGIICPTTGSIFSLKDGAIVEWYPSNPVLRLITPRSSRLPVFPTKMTQEAISINVDGTELNSSVLSTRGGADTSLENNNVFAEQPSMYVSGSGQDESGGGGLSTAATLLTAITGFGIIATAGTATALYYEDFVLLGGFWALMLAVGGFFTYQFLQGPKDVGA